MTKHKYGHSQNDRLFSYYNFLSVSKADQNLCLLHMN